MKTNEMLNSYVRHHKLGDAEQREFIDSFIAELGLELDGRMVKLHSKWQSRELNFKIRATRHGVEEFICNQLMSNSQGRYHEFIEDFKIEETAQPNLVLVDNFLKALADGQKAVEESEKWEESK